MKKSFRFEFEKFIAGTAFFNRREKGCYIDLLCYQAGKGRMTIEEIKNVLNGDFDCWDKVKGKYIEENGQYYNKKLEEILKGNCKPTEEEIKIDREKIEQRIKDTKLKFYNDCKPFLEKYPKEMLRRFYNYWVELNKSGTKMRFELERTFEISRRLVTWANNDKSFGKVKQDELITYKELLNRFNKGETDVWDLYGKVTIDNKIYYKRKTIAI